MIKNINVKDIKNKLKDRKKNKVVKEIITNNIEYKRSFLDKIVLSMFIIFCIMFVIMMLLVIFISVA